MLPGTLNNHFLLVVSIGWTKSLHRKWLFHHFHPFKTGCLGCQVYNSYNLTSMRVGTIQIYGNSYPQSVLPAPPLKIYWAPRGCRIVFQSHPYELTSIKFVSAIFSSTKQINGTVLQDLFLRRWTKVPFWKGAKTDHAVILVWQLCGLGLFFGGVLFRPLKTYGHDLARCTTLARHGTAGHHLAQALPDERMREALLAEKLPFEARSGKRSVHHSINGFFRFERKGVGGIGSI